MAQEASIANTVEASRSFRCCGVTRSGTGHGASVCVRLFDDRDFDRGSAKFLMLRRDPQRRENGASGVGQTTKRN